MIQQADDFPVYDLPRQAARVVAHVRDWSPDAVIDWLNTHGVVDMVMLFTDSDPHFPGHPIYRHTSFGGVQGLFHFDSDGSLFIWHVDIIIRGNDDDDLAFHYIS
jgi:hypothetical protein